MSHMDMRRVSYSGPELDSHTLPGYLPSPELSHRLREAAPSSSTGDDGGEIKPHSPTPEQEEQVYLSRASNDDGVRLSPLLSRNTSSLSATLSDAISRRVVLSERARDSATEEADLHVLDDLTMPNKKVEFLLETTKNIPPSSSVYPPAQFSDSAAEAEIASGTGRPDLLETASNPDSLHSDLSLDSTGTGKSGNSNMSGRAARYMNFVGGRKMSRFILRIPILYRSIAIIFWPILGLTVFAALLVNQSALNLQSASRDVDLTNFAGELSSFVHELQVERSRTSVYLACRQSSGAGDPVCVELKERLDEERAIVLAARTHLEYVTNTRDIPVIKQPIYLDAYRRIAGLESQHVLIDDGTLDYTAAVMMYDEIIRAFYDTEHALYSYIESTHILRLYIPYIQLQDTAEVTAQLRWVGTKLAREGKFQSIKEQEHFGYLVDTSREIIRSLESSAPKAILDIWANYKTDNSLFDQLVAELYEYGTTTTRPRNDKLADAWFDLITGRLDALHRAGKAVFREMDALSQSSKAVQARDLSTVVVTTVLLVLFCALLTYVLAVSVTATTTVLKKEVQKRKRTAQATQRFFPSEFMSLLGHHSVADIEDGMHTRVSVTVMFMDIRDFTSICEGLELDQTFKLLHEYAKIVSPIITANRGFIDKMMGDGIMAVFETGPDAIRAAVRVQYELACINRETSSMLGLGAQRPLLRVGIGIHLGDVILGTLGDSKRIDGTIVGDAVNVASRLEELTKFYGVNIIASQAVIDSCSNADDLGNLAHRYIGEVRVKGKSTSVPIFDVYHADELEMKMFKDDTRLQFEEASQLYANGEFEQADSILQELESSFPVKPDQAVSRRREQSKIHKKRLADHRVVQTREIEDGDQEKAPLKWDGVDSFTGKDHQ
eukprot:TRINITY_DN1452_c1_g1_i1.p1 TRINITY_DN1452_c1_g1~~TRINITY_DN1452_c1_g1_i1.p1  ORF type:complete len:893 (-),score=92.71 TRINITY_DN1452_c1_g1_i1:53-2731(-)